ncbi:MAG: DUF2892 domain-containing protein [Candidatus Omnitrophica bacterium]|nr:DUF2892 domain-containing protein [Candidatus Omnitrophota bacterium]
MDRMLRGIAGFFIIFSVLLSVTIDPRWLIFTAFVGLNLLQSAFTDWCPMMWVIRKMTREKPEGGCRR